MSELALLEEGPYRGPEGAEDFGDRITEGKKIILYIGEKAIVDVVERSVVDNREVLGHHLLRVMDTPDKALDLLHHTPVYVPEETAIRVFDPPKAA